MRIITSLGIGVVSIICYFSPPIVLAALFGLICTIILLFEWPQLAKSNNIWPLTPLYAIVPFAMLIYFCFAPEGKIIIFTLFLIVWSFDTGSYIFGNICGKTPINRTISPNKTWEGVLGGVITTIMLYLILNFFYFHDPIDISNILAVILISISALLGDLFESKLKRNAQTKDSGALLPGHGGLLDRFDGILFAIVIVYILHILDIFF